MKNYYQVLGVQSTASKEEIKEAYKKLSKKMHPDMNSGDEFFTEFFKSINEAHQVLTDDAQRRTYNYKLHDFSADINFLKEKEMLLQEKEATLMQRYFRRKMLVKGSVTLVAGLAVIAAFLLSFDSSNAAENTTPAATHEEKLIVNETPVKTPQVDLADNSSAKNRHINVSAPVTAKNTVITPVKIETQHAAPVKRERFYGSGDKDSKRWTEAEMAAVFHVIEKEKIRANNTSNTIRIIRSDNSNIENAFDLAGFLQTKGYVIAGRETTIKPVNGIRADCTTSCIVLSVGAM